MKLTIGMRNAGINAIVLQANGGRIDFLSGPVPDPDGGLIAGTTVLFSVPIPSGGFGNANNAQAVMGGLPTIVTVQADGYNSFARIYGPGDQPLWDAYPNVDYTIDSQTVLAGGTVKLNSFVYQKPQ